MMEKQNPLPIGFIHTGSRFEQRIDLLLLFFPLVVKIMVFVN